MTRDRRLPVVPLAAVLAVAAGVLAWLVIASRPASKVVNARPGDVNGDGAIDRKDADYLSEYIYAKGPAPVGPADLNGDGKVDVQDLFALTRLLPSTPATRTPGEGAHPPAPTPGSGGP